MRTQFSEPPGYDGMTETIASRAGSEVEVVMDPAGRIDGLGIGPLSQAPAVQSATCGPALDPS